MTPPPKKNKKKHKRRHKGKELKPLLRGGPGTLGAKEMKRWIAFRDKRLAGNQQPGRARIAALFAEFTKLREQQRAPKSSETRPSAPKPRILQAHYPLPNDAQLLKLLTLKLVDMPYYAIAELVDALIARLEQRIDDDMRRAISDVLDEVRAFAIEVGAELMVLIGRDDFFRWPTTFAPGGSGNLRNIDWEKEGLLSVFGYHVGLSSTLSVLGRRAILDRVYRTPLGPDNPRHIRAEWGAPSTSQRLRKLANTIASLTRHAKRNRFGSYGVAIQEWEEDLYYLYVQHYIGRYAFPWPRSAMKTATRTG
jgi:hypothetical protein